MRESPTLASTSASDGTTGLTGVTLPAVGASVSPGASGSSPSPTLGAPRPASGSAITAMAVTVVPMPRWEGLAMAVRKMSVFALEIVRTNSLAVGRVATGSSESPLAAIASSRCRMPSTAIWLATSPASCPPIPSATTNVVSVTRRLSSFSGRTRPLSVADPTRSSAIADRPSRHCASITVVPTWRRSPGWSSFAPFNFTPLWYVPLVDPRSSTIGCPS